MRDTHTELSIHRIIDGFWAAGGKLKQAGDVAYLIAPGSASGTIQLFGTYSDAVIEVLGASTTDADYAAPRMVYHSGFGSTASNVHKSIGGTNAHDEILVASNGFGFAVRLISITSGTLEIEMSATTAPNLVFGNGPFHNAEEQAVRDGRAFLATTGIVPVEAGNVLHCILQNPSDSGVNYYVTERRFSNSSSDVLEYQSYRNPTAVLSQTMLGRNRNFASENLPSASLKYQVAATGVVTMGGDAGTGEQLSPKAITPRPLLIVMGPGQKLGFTLSGAGANLNNAARLSVTLEWYEEPV